MKINDLDLSKENWKKTKEKILINSLWIINRRNNKYGSNKFHGNFVSEIPEQFILRYTRKGETVWDCFAGSGTTIDVARELERECVANDISPIRKDIILGDSRYFNPGKKVQLIIMHPPYAGIIRFSNKDEDISNVKTPKEFYPLFKEVVNNVVRYLEKNRYLILVIGDCYLNGTYIPLGYECMNICRKSGLQLKAEIIKNMGGNERRGKDTNLWIYRGLKGGFFMWKHEHIFVFRNKGE